GRHRHPHACPPRRSSDLEYRFNRNHWVRGHLGANLINNFDKFDLRGTSELPQVRTHIREYLTTSDVVLENLQYNWTRRLNRDLRSEEHTSELQSRENLVC